MQPNKPECKGCAVQQGYVPAGAVMQINESTPDALRYAAALECDEHEGRRKAAACLRAQHARIAELESQLAAAQQGVQPVATRYRLIVGGRPRKWETGDVEMMDEHYFLAAQKRGEIEMHPLYTHPTTQGMDVQKLHSDIMNIQAGKHMGLSYREGHRDARHAAAELVLAAQAKQGEQANG